jgi:hypothetical protein
MVMGGVGVKVNMFMPFHKGINIAMHEMLFREARVHGPFLFSKRN